jgi:hypothetical protein
MRIASCGWRLILIQFSCVMNSTRIRPVTEPIFVAALVCLMCLAPGCVHGIRHNPDSAAAMAILFAKRGLIDRNFSAAYQVLAKGTKQQLSAEAFKNLMLGLHPNSWPKKLSAVEYEPVPGQQAINIYLYGKEGDEIFLYKLVMEGTVDDGYKVSSISRQRNLPSQSTTRIRFGAARTTNDELL